MPEYCIDDSVNYLILARGTLPFCCSLLTVFLLALKKPTKQSAHTTTLDDREESL